MSDESHSVPPVEPEKAAPVPDNGSNGAGGGGRVYLDNLETGAHTKFRPKRLRAKDLDNLAVEVTIHGSDGQHRCELHNISTSGLAFWWDRDTSLPSASRISDLSVSIESSEVYRGEVAIRSVRTLDGRQQIGASFVEGPINIEDVKQLREIKERDAYPQLIFEAETRPWHSKDTRVRTFEGLIAELHLFLREAADRFATVEREIPWEVLHGDKDTPARRALRKQLEGGFVRSYIDYTEKIDAALREAPSSCAESMKAFSQALLHDTLISAPFMHRCLSKPLGYPGDYIVMQYLYERQFEGPNLLAKAIHLASVFTRGACAVRARKDMLRDVIIDTTRERAARGLRTRVISIAAGPAQEIFEVIERAPELVPQLDILLFDQDEDALELVNNRLTRAREARCGEEINIELRRDTIRHLLKEQDIFESFGPADLVFSAGLFDYLRFHTAVGLVRNLHGNLAEGGVLYIGNMVPENPCKWFLEHHLEWYLEYRTRDELRAMGQAAVPEHKAEVVEEWTGVNPFLRIRR